jgi:hypothetical protein
LLRWVWIDRKQQKKPNPTKFQGLVRGDAFRLLDKLQESPKLLE